MVLAAGFGSRLRPLSDAVPKPLMPLWGRPLLAHTLDLLRSWGVCDAVVNLHHGAYEILSWLRARPADGLRVRVSFEPEILGTGGALRRAARLLGDGPLWIINADVAAELDPAPLRRALTDPRTVAAVWLHPALGPRTVETRAGFVRRFRSAHPGAPGTATFCGVQLVRPELVRFAPASGFATLVEVYEAAMRAGRRVAGVECPRAYWADVGTPERYLQTHRDVVESVRRGAPGARFFDRSAPARLRSLRRAGVTIRGFASIAPTVRVARGVVIEDSAVWDDATVAAGAVLRHAIVGRGAVVRGPVTHVAVRGAETLSPAEERALSAAGWTPSRFTAVLLDPRGSDRAFLRLDDGRRTCVLIRYGRQRPENERYAGHTRFLQSIGVGVPGLLAEDPAERFLIFEDLGDRSLGDAVAGLDESGVKALYGTVLSALARFQVDGAREAQRRGLELEQPFGPALFRREHRLFIEHYLARPPARDAAFRRAVARELARVARRLETAPAVLLHRDLQSSNLFVTSDGIAFIDYQGMRMGPAVYDLASLLCDPYVELPLDLQCEVLDRYARAVGADLVRPDLFWFGAIQRLTQALGAYARLGALPGASRFLHHIPPALRMLRRALKQSGMKLPALEEAARGG